MKKKFIPLWFSALPFTIAVRILVTFLLKKILRIPINFYFSQTGEDIILSTLIPDDNGFYIDVGCNEPIEKSNTFIFYLKGWKGITIDANEELIKKHRRIRKLDTPICAAVSNTSKSVTFYKSKANAASTIDEDYYTENRERWYYDEQQTLHTKTLTEILDTNLQNGTTIDLLTVDVEGVDLQVLQGLDFNKYRPKIIIVEAHDFSIADKENHPVYKHLSINNYQLHAFATMNLYFIDSFRRHIKI